MFQPRSIQSSMNFKDKVMMMDYVLIFSILFLGIISMFAMYSTDGGKFDYHTRSHILRFGIFFLMFLIISFFQIRFWYQTSTLLYLSFFILLLGVKYFGLTSSGSQRWLNFYFMNLQPSELMKIGLILFLAKYYHRISTQDVNKLKFFVFTCSSFSCTSFISCCSTRLRYLDTNCVGRGNSIVARWCPSKILCLCIYIIYFFNPHSNCIFKTLSKGKNIDLFESR